MTDDGQRMTDNGRWMSAATSRVPHGFRGVAKGAAVAGVALVLAFGCAKAPPANPSGFRTLFQQGQSIDAFIASADFRKKEWRQQYADATVPDSTLERARAVPGTWKLLVVAADWCADSYHTVPYLARLAEQVPGLELRIVSTGPGKAVQRAYRTPDGRVATPVVLILDDRFREQGCMVERPTALEQYYLAERVKGESDAAAHEDVVDWYDRDRGRSALSEIVARLQDAADGKAVCEARSAR